VPGETLTVTGEVSDVDPANIRTGPRRRLRVC
jgi:hypothetical protein